MAATSLNKRHFVSYVSTEFYEAKHASKHAVAKHVSNRRQVVCFQDSKCPGDTIDLAGDKLKWTEEKLQASYLMPYCLMPYTKLHNLGFPVALISLLSLDKSHTDVVN
jgi:hypothetical protein